MTGLKALAAAATALFIAACAANGPRPPLSPAQKTALHITAITAQAGRDVILTQDAMERITGHIREVIMADSPKVLAAAEPGAPPLAMKLVITAYDGGVIGVPFDQRRSAGVSRIDADVLFVDAGGKTVAQSKVETHFGTSGDVGIGTNILNVEDDFERAVARLVR